MVELSIVTVSLNNIDGLARTIRSVAEQAPDSRFEHVIVDGSSTDGSVDLLSQYASTNAYVNYLSEPDKGIYDAMNKGLTRSRGRYVYFLNAGDTFTDDTIVKQLLSLLSDATHAWFIGDVVHLNGGKSAPTLIHCVPFSGRRMWLGRQLYNHQGVILSKDELINFGGFDHTSGFAADARAMLQFCRNSDPHPIPFTLALYEGGGFSASRVQLSPFEFHRFRVELLGLSRLPRIASYLWAFTQVLRRNGVVEGTRLWHRKNG